MARVTNVIINGTVGNMVLYHRMGKTCARLKREGIKQTHATKMRSENFGIASRAAKYLRKGLQAVIPIESDRSMQSRFSGAIAKWLRLSKIDALAPCDTAPHISGFQFSGGDGFSERFRVPVTVSKVDDRLMTVAIKDFIPAKHIIAPPGTLMIELVVAVAGSILKTGMPSGSSVQRMQVPYNHEAIASQVLQFPVPSPAGSLTIAAAWLQYYVFKNNRISRSENPDFMPAAVINARYN